MGTAPANLTLGARLEAAAGSGGTITFVGGAGERDRVSWGQLHEEARAVAANLQALGLAPGDHVCLVGSTTRDLVTAVQAVWLAGAATVVLPLPLRLGSVEEFVAQTRARIRSADGCMVLAEPELAQFVEAGEGDPPVITLDKVRPGAGRPGSESLEVPRADPSSLAILQFTSGSTADPKGVMLPHAQVVTNIGAITEALRLEAGRDVVVSWLPLYHDMGLIGLLATPMIVGTDLALGAPQDFMASPVRWMEWIAEFGGTATGGPNFGYALAARALTRRPGLDLSSWRLALIGAEPIDPASVDAFCAAGAPNGLDRGAAFCAYGLAEATLAVTFPSLGSGMVTHTVDRRALEHEACAVAVDPADERGRRLPLLGRPIRDVEVRVVDPSDGRLRAEREVGEVEIRGGSVTPGYYRHAKATADSFRGEWLRTGDLGYTTGGELVVCGRQKDLIIVGGRNVYPEDVERAVASIPGIRAGNVIAFGIEGRRGRERLVVVAETREEDRPSLRRSAADRVRHAVGFNPADVVLLAPGTLPKTSSGKPQRSLCRQRYLQAELEPA